MGHGQRPGLVHAAPEGRMQNDAHIARFIGACLHHEPPIRGHRPGTGALRLYESRQVAQGVLVQPVGRQAIAQRRGHGILLRTSLRRFVPFGSARNAAVERPHKSPPGAARLVGATNGLAVPEGQSRGASRRRFHDNPVGADLLDAPGARAQGDDVAHARLHHHLLVQLAHTPAPLTGVALGQHHREHAAIGNGTRRRYGQALGTGARREQPRLAIPQDARRELGHLARAVAPGEHVEHSLEGASAQIGIAGRPPHAGEPLVGWKAVRRHGHSGHGLLGQHIERIAHEPRALDGAGLHALGHDGGIDDLHPGTREDDALGAAAHLVVRPPHALQPAGHRGRRGHLQHQIDGTHIDAQFQAGNGHHAGQLPRLQLPFHLQPLLLGDRSVMGLRDDHRGLGHQFGGGADVGAEGRPRRTPHGIGARGHAAHRIVAESRRIAATRSCPEAGHLGMGRVQAEALRVQLVQACRQLFAQTARVHEDNRGFVGQHLVQNGRLDMGPDGGAAQAAVRMRRGRRALGHDSPQRPIGFPCILDGCPARTGAPLPRAVPGTGKSPEGGDGRHVAHGHAHRKIEARKRLRGYHRHGPHAAEEPGHFLARAHRGRQPDALGRSLQQIVQPLQRQRQVRPALVAGQGVHLVHDDRLNRAQRLSGRRGEHEVQRLGRRDENVGRIAGDLAALVSGGVAGAHGRADFGGFRATARALDGRQLGDGRKRPLQVAVHIGAESLQGRYVQHAHAANPLLACFSDPSLLAHERVDRPQERRQRLARARRRYHERVLAPRDGLPRLALHRRGRPEGIGEPVAHRFRERGHGLSIIHR